MDAEASPVAKKTKTPTELEILMQTLGDMSKKLEDIQVIKQSMSQHVANVQQNTKNIEKIRAQVNANTNTTNSLQTKMSAITMQQETAEVEIKNTNLCISGIEDLSAENADALIQQISKLFIQITGQRVNFDTVHRAGKYDKQCQNKKNEGSFFHND